ncbi:MULTISPECIES: hypothetical protein [unclassified Caballeronia]|uniref:hypothetical protein n=1 Tax=unclassified Caballeronia TaxID=2646786 RepID=UPI0028644171|nr:MULTISPECIES: hypothetical protein [unclassified Caballeronia]MDR5753166.1 hypothetical protein [Caballeronia sp. LZ024]MDR5840905.1 hypothetical protein [Caballeronia sp. LZ031]
MDDPYERRALLLHLGDVLEAIFCLSKCADSRASIGEALQKDDALVSFAILSQVDAGMHPQAFVRRATGAFFVWPKALLDETLNRRLLAHTVQHDLFAGNEAGWNAYLSERRKEVPWFGEDLPDVPESKSAAAGETDATVDSESASEDARSSRYSTWPWPANE